MAMEKYKRGVPEGLLINRLNKLQAVLEKRDLDAAIIVNKTDFFYFTGTVQQGWLYVPREGPPLLMVCEDYNRARAESSLERVVSLSNNSDAPRVLEAHGYPRPQHIGMELDVLPANIYFQFKNLFRTVGIMDISIDVRLIRAVKSGYEIKMIRRASWLADKVAAKVPELLEPGKTEIALAGEIEAYARSMGHQGIVRMRLWGSEVFYGHLFSGASGVIPSCLSAPPGCSGPSPGPGASRKKIEKNEPVLLDYVFALDGYLSGHSRIFSIGPLPDELLKAHDAMLELQALAKREGVPGVLSGDLYEIMLAAANERGYADYFMGVGERRLRFTGHGLGLELDEFPFVAKGHRIPLEAGMVIAMEPKVVLPGKGVVGVANTVVVTESGLETLTTMREDVVIC